ncbi:glycosyltransferase [Acidithiobacillus ferridurans]|nr:glycosyltransferase [Acidithiobacillus ferridurans]
MNTGGTDQRKNLDGLFRAFASLPAEMRKAHALVLVGREVADEKHHFLDLAKQAGLRESELVFTGYVSDSELNLLYNACTLFVLPSWHEDSGLPALEAMACGTAVIAANSSSLPEVVGRQDVLFAPGDHAAMAAKMAEVLANAEFREELERHGVEQAKKFSWVESAQRAWSALSKLQAQWASVSEATPSRLPHRPKLAFVSPLPPEKTGIADYSAKLLPELARHYDITVIVQQDTVNDAWVQANAPVHDVAWFCQHVSFFDRVLYQFGNSAFHSYMFDLLIDIPGLVVLHDFYLSDFFWHRDIIDARSGSWAQNLFHSHGWTAVQKRFEGNDAQLVMAYPSNLNVIIPALSIIVHSDFSRQLARLFYGAQAGKDWALIPLLRQPVNDIDRAAARKKLGLAAEEFIVCSFGLLGATKLNHRLLEAWLASPLSKDRQCRLIFVGENTGGDCGRKLLETIAQSTAKNSIQITGWADAEAYRNWLAAADIAVQLRTLSRGETSAAVLDCMNYGLPVIVNAHGSMAELPSDALWLLPDTFSEAQLIDALTTLWREPARRSTLGARAQQHIRSQHQPRRCADLYAEAIEGAYAQAENSLYGLMQALPRLEASLPPEEYPRLANALATNFPPQPRRRQLLLDVSALAQNDLKTGIERVTRALLEQIVLNPPAGWAVEAVYATSEQAGYRYARQFMCRFFGIPGDWSEDAPVQVWQGDIFFGLDFHPHVIPAQEGTFNAWRNRGVSVYFMVYDLLPVLMPEVFPEGAKEGHQRWLQTITHMDGTLCISRAVADELYDWLQTFGEKRECPFAVDWFHLGADVVDNGNPSRGLPSDAPQTLRSLADRPSFLMVGTIEPRKGVLQTLQAFNQLWAQGVDSNLVIVGKEGWKPVPDHQRGDIPQTVRALRTHPEFGKRLFWLEAISDEYLEQVYGTSTCLIAASYGEGFGLPLIEAASHGLPLLVRDIPVFREVTAGKAQFFTDSHQPEVIAEATRDWLALYRQGKHPHSDAIAHLTWVESARIALEIVLGNTPPYRTWLPDGVRRYWGADPRLGTEVGEAKGRSMQTTGKAGYLVHGPYERFEPRRYRVAIQGSADHLTGGESLDIVCNKGETVLQQYTSWINESLGAWHDLEFTLETKADDLEIRIWVGEQSRIIIDGINFWPEALQ